MNIAGRIKQILAGESASTGFTGDFKSWDEARNKSTGYSTPQILEKTRAALLKVKAGEAAFERDSVAFETMEYEFPLLAGLLRAAVAGGGFLSVLDFGGSLGSTYFQSRKFLFPVKQLRWSVVDQPEQVACGMVEFANEELHFYRSIDECLSAERPTVLLLSNVIQYLPEPYAFLEETVKLDIPNLIIERTAFSRDGKDRLTVQCVSKSIYQASYPAWFLSEALFRRILASRYELVCEYLVDKKLCPRAKNAVFKNFQFYLRSATFKQ